MALLQKTIEKAVSENCKRMRWQVLDRNTRAIRLYERIGAKIDTSWYNCDLNEAVLTIGSNLPLSK